MKIGIVTFPGSTSFGASLQMYALYSAVKALGVDVEVVNYQNTYMKTGRHTKAAQNSKLKNMCREVLHIRQKLAFARFEKTMLTMYPSRAIHDPQKLLEIGKRYDGAICGSDQVWNPNVTGMDLNYFLSFCSSKTKRISYAPSFGLSCLPQAFADQAGKELEKFEHISVREQEGEEIVRKLLDKSVPVVADPTFLLTEDDWSKLERKPAVTSQEYILYYTVRSSKTLKHFCEELAKKKNMKIICVGGNAFSRMKNKNAQIDYAYDMDPGEWLYLMRHASCIVTNSFHGTAFSLNFKKDFYVEFSSTANSRLEHIIRIAGLKSRIVGDGCDGSEEHIDYSRVNPALKEMRDQSWAYLRRAVGLND